MSGILQDLAYALRMLRKAPGFTAIAVLTFTLGVGVNVAIFSVVDAVALRGLGVADPDRIVAIQNVDPAHPDRPDYSSWIEVSHFRAEAQAFAAIAASDRRAVIVKDNGEAHLLLTDVVSDNYFDVMRVMPAAGRTFTAGESRAPGAPPVMMISYDYWSHRYDRDPRVIGQTILTSGTNCVIVGVLPRSFRGTDLFLNPDVYMPADTWLTVNPGERVRLDRPASRNLDVFGRLRPDVTASQGAAALAVIQQQLAREYPADEAGRRLDVVYQRDTRGSTVKRLSELLMGIAALVLLLACANIANLLFARGEVRRGEMASRVALGASRARIVRQLVTETLVLAIPGGVAAVVLAGWVISVLPSLLPAMPYTAGFDFRLDARALAVGAFVTILCAIVAGTLPAFRASNIAPVMAIKESSSGGRPGWWRDTIVVGQVAITVLLLIASGLVARTLMAVSRLDPGFDSAGNILIASMSVRGLTLEQEHALYRRMQERLAAMPGVQGVAVASRVPLWGSGGGAAVQAWIPGLPDADRDGVRIGFSVVSSGYFSTIGTRILEGRAIGPEDNETAPLAAVLNESAARLLWPNQDPLGKRFRVNGPRGREVEVVGIAQDGRYLELTEHQRSYLFLPLYQEAQIFGSRWGAEVAVVRTAAQASTQASAIRRALGSVSENALVLDMTTMNEHIRSALYDDRLMVQLIGSMGGIGLLLAAVGLFGVISYSVTRRTREIAVRVALGADTASVLRMVFGRALMLAGGGIAVGVLVALASGRVVASLLYGVSIHDPLTFVAAAVVMACVAMAAAAMPARRAVRVDPVEALRSV